MTLNSAADVVLTGAAVAWVLARQVRLARSSRRIGAAALLISRHARTGGIAPETGVRCFRLGNMTSAAM